MLKFKTYDYVTNKMYVMQLGKHRLSASVANNKRRFVFAYATMMDDTMYVVKGYKSVEF